VNDCASEPAGAINGAKIATTIQATAIAAPIAASGCREIAPSRRRRAGRVSSARSGACLRMRLVDPGAMGEAAQLSF